MTQRQSFVKTPEIFNGPPMMIDFSRKKAAFASKVIDDSNILGQQTKNTEEKLCHLDSCFFVKLR